MGYSGHILPMGYSLLTPSLHLYWFQLKLGKKNKAQFQEICFSRTFLTINKIIGQIWISRYMPSMKEFQSGKTSVLNLQSYILKVVHQLSVRLCCVHQIQKKALEYSKGFSGGASGKEPTYNARDIRGAGSIPGSGRSLEEDKATHSNILAQGIPWTEERGESNTTLATPHACRIFKSNEY